MRILGLIVVALFTMFVFADTLTSQEKKTQKAPAIAATDSTVRWVKVDQYKADLRKQIENIQTQGNALIQAAQAQINLLEGVRQDSILVKVK